MTNEHELEVCKNSLLVSGRQTVKPIHVEEDFIRMNEDVVRSAVRF